MVESDPFPTARDWPLPKRRKSVLIDAAWTDPGGTEVPLVIDLGYDAAGNVREIFATGPREGSSMQAFISDACIVLSLALQHGVAPNALLKSLGTFPAWSPSGVIERPASTVGTLVQALIDNQTLTKATKDL